MSYWIRNKETMVSVIDGYCTSIGEAINKYKELIKKNKKLEGKIAVYSFSGKKLFG